MKGFEGTIKKLLLFKLYVSNIFVLLNDLVLQTADILHQVPFHLWAHFTISFQVILFFCDFLLDVAFIQVSGKLQHSHEAVLVEWLDFFLVGLNFILVTLYLPIVFIQLLIAVLHYSNLHWAIAELRFLELDEHILSDLVHLFSIISTLFLDVLLVVSKNINKGFKLWAEVLPFGLLVNQKRYLERSVLDLLLDLCVPWKQNRRLICDEGVKFVKDIAFSKLVV